MNDLVRVRTSLPPQPMRIKQLRVDSRGYPVPWFVDWNDGKPDFRVIGYRKIQTAIQQNLCWVCGQPMYAHKTFVSGPMASVNRVSAEPPSHHECAEFSAKACPFLILPKAVRREANMPAEAQELPGVMITRNPGVAMLWTTKQFKVMRVQGGVLFNIGPPEKVEWFTEGRPSTRVEVLDSISTGLPYLSEMAVAEGPKALNALQQSVENALAYLPD